MKVDHVLVLHGDQGIYKSGFFSVLGGDFYDSSATNRLGDKDTKLIIHSCWIEEFAEYERLNKREQGEVKHWFTLQFDNFRKPYGRVTENHQRRCVFGASCNKHEFLVDETGDRRMWVVPVNVDRLPLGKIDLDLLAKERDGIWAAAVDAYLAGEKWWTDRAEEKEISQSNEQFRSYDEWTEIVRGWIEQRGCQEVVIREVLDQALLIAPGLQDRKVQMRVADILTRLGWIKVVKGKTRARIWVNKEETGDQPAERLITPVDHPVEPLQNGHSSETMRGGDQPPPEKTKSIPKDEPSDLNSLIDQELIRLGWDQDDEQAWHLVYHDFLSRSHLSPDQLARFHHQLTTMTPRKKLRGQKTIV
jgi:predicted P-loop ATPase